MCDWGGATEFNSRARAKRVRRGETNQHEQDGVLSSSSRVNWKYNAIFTSNGALWQPLFKMPTEHENDGSINPSKSMIWAGWICSVVFVLLLLVVAVKVPNPTPFQYHVFLLVMALSASGWVAFVPGFLLANMLWNTRFGHVSIQGGGAIVSFLVVWFFVPTAIRATISPGFGIYSTVSVQDVPAKSNSAKYVRASYLNPMFAGMMLAIYSNSPPTENEVAAERRKIMQTTILKMSTNILDRRWTVQITNLRPEQVSINDFGLAVLLSKDCSLKVLLPNMRESITGIKSPESPPERRPVILLPRDLLLMNNYRLPALLAPHQTISFSFDGVHVTGLAYLARQAIEFQHFIQSDPSQVPRKVWIIPYAVTSTGSLLPLLGEGIEALQESLDQESHYLFVGLSKEFGITDGFWESTSNFVSCYVAEFGNSFGGAEKFLGDKWELSVPDESVWATKVGARPSKTIGSGDPCNPTLTF